VAAWRGLEAEATELIRASMDRAASRGEGRGVTSQYAAALRWNLAVTASATATVDCIATWTTDFRDDLPGIDVPVLVIQGDADQVLPLDKTGRRLPALVSDARLTVIEGGAHAIPWTHAEQVNTALLDFIRS
jgi:non-heme chloroperoxidase